MSKLCQFLSCPIDVHLVAIKRVLHFLKGSLNAGLMLFKPSNLDLICNIDSDWASCSDDRRSVSGYCTFFGWKLVSWKSSKPRIVSCSSAEAEYCALAGGTAEVLWITSLLQELGVKLNCVPKLMCDRISALHIVHNPMQHVHTKCIEIDCPFVREQVLKK